MTPADWRVLWSEGAAAQAHAIAEWWAENRLAAVGLFEDELAKAIARLAAQPMAGASFGSSVLSGLRRLLLPRSRYHVYYRIDHERHLVLVHAVWHAARRQPPAMP